MTGTSISAAVFFMCFHCEQIMRIEDEVVDPHVRLRDSLPFVVRVVDHEFQQQVLEKLGRLEANVEMLVGDWQPGRMKIAEDKIFALQRSEIRRGVYDKIISAVIATVVSIVIALHDHLFARRAATYELRANLDRSEFKTHS